MNKQHSVVSAVLTLGLFLGLVGGLLSGARADEKHPHYLKALADLRYARAWLSAPGDQRQMPQEKEAVDHINRAIAEINRASIDDHKDINDHPPVDANLKHKDRLNKAVALLTAAHKDLMYEEDDRKALAWRKAAVKHLDGAIRATRQAANE